MRHAPIIGAVLIAALGVSACRQPFLSSNQADNVSTSEASSAPPPAVLNLSYDAEKPVPGTKVLATAEGLTPGRKVTLVWGTVEGGWVVEDYFRFLGKTFKETTKPLLEAEVDARGRLSVGFVIPEDFGGVHEVFVQDAGVTVAQGGVEVSQTFELSPREGPVGTPIELRVTGLGWRNLESTWVVNWDNQQLGYVSATSTRGTAVARFRATGPIGDHTLTILTGWSGQGYLNHEQAPNAHLPRPNFTFRVTPGRAAMPAHYAEPYQRQPIPESKAGPNAAVARLEPTQGPVGSRATLTVSGLPADAPVSLVWGTAQGNRVGGSGFEQTEKELGNAMADSDGRIEMPLTVPDDLGGLHSLSVRAGSETLARTHFVIETSIVGMWPTSGPVGTAVTIHLKGVGWTDYDNIYIATYDNAYMGYACGFNSQGDVVINFKAAGAPGIHLIDLYPGIYQGPEGGQQLYRQPQLTYADDHPGNRIPALRFAFEVTPPGTRPAGARPTTDTR